MPLSSVRKMVIMPKQLPPEVRDRAVGTIMDRLSEYSFVYAACKAPAPKLGVGPESLRRWVVQARIDAGEKTGPSSDELEEIKRLRAEVLDFKESNEILNVWPQCFHLSHAWFQRC
jgi:transposase